MPRSIGVADTSRKRLRGLARTALPDAPAGLLLPRTRSVHTFGMRFALHLVWLDRAGAIVRIDADVPPRRFRSCIRATSVLEIPARTPPARPDRNDAGPAR